MCGSLIQNRYHHHHHRDSMFALRPQFTAHSASFIRSFIRSLSLSFFHSFLLSTQSIWISAIDAASGFCFDELLLIVSKTVFRMSSKTPKKRKEKKRKTGQIERCWIGHPENWYSSWGTMHWCKSLQCNVGIYHPKPTLNLKAKPCVGAMIYNRTFGFFRCMIWVPSVGFRFSVGFSLVLCIFELRCLEISDHGTISILYLIASLLVGSWWSCCHILLS